MFLIGFFVAVTLVYFIFFSRQENKAINKFNDSLAAAAKKANILSLEDIESSSYHIKPGGTIFNNSDVLFFKHKSNNHEFGYMFEILQGEVISFIKFKPARVLDNIDSLLKFYKLRADTLATKGVIFKLEDYVEREADGMAYTLYSRGNTDLLMEKISSHNFSENEFYEVIYTELRSNRFGMIHMIHGSDSNSVLFSVTSDFANDTEFNDDEDITKVIEDVIFTFPLRKIIDPTMVCMIHDSISEEEKEGLLSIYSHASISLIMESAKSGKYNFNIKSALLASANKLGFKDFRNEHKKAWAKYSFGVDI